MLTMHAMGGVCLIGRALNVKVKEGFGEEMEFVWGLKETILGYGLVEVRSQGWVNE